MTPEKDDTAFDIQDVISKFTDMEIYEEVREIYRDVVLEYGTVGKCDAIFMKILGRHVATVEIPDKSEPFSYVHYGCDYTVFSPRIRKMYSI